MNRKQRRAFVYARRNKHAGSKHHNAFWHSNKHKRHLPQKETA